MRLFPLLLLVALATLGGCQKSPTLQQQEPPHKITLAYTTQPDCALIHIALVKNYFVEEGLEIIPQLHTFGRMALKSVLDGNADLATVAEIPVMFATFSGEKIFLLATISSSNKNNAIIGRKDRGIFVPGDLKGKRIAYVAGTTSEFFMDSFFNLNNIKRSEVKLLSLKPDEMLGELKLDKLDAAVIWNFPLAHMRTELGEEGVTFYDTDIYQQTFNISAQQEFVQKNPETIKRFLRALIKAEEFTRNDPGAARTLVAAALKIDKHLLQKILSDFDFRVTLDKSLLLSLEDESRWAMTSRLVDPGAKMPNYLKVIYPELLKEVKTEATNIHR